MATNLGERYGSKPLELAKNKNTIELNSEADVLRKVCEAAELGELDKLIAQQIRQLTYG